MSKQIHADYIKAEVKNCDIAIVKFTAEWCAPCKQIAKELEKVVKERPEVTLFEVDTDASDGSWEQYNIAGVPTMFCYKDGKKVGKRLVGSANKDEIKEWINECTV